MSSKASVAQQRVSKMIFGHSRTNVTWTVEAEGCLVWWPGRGDVDRGAIIADSQAPNKEVTCGRAWEVKCRALPGGVPKWA